MSVESDVIEIIRGKSSEGLEIIDRGTQLPELGIESLEMVELIFELEDKFEIEIPYNANSSEMEFQTVGDVVDAIAKLVAERG
ncbi:MAG: acyl carrier protein [Flavobacteriaceae bacterium]